MTFTPTPIVLAGPVHVTSDGVVVTADDGSICMYFKFDDIDAAKAAADGERKAQVREGRRAPVTA
jgi:hypothetical protein